jgi:proteasome accessory factor C
LRRLLVMLPWLMERDETPVAEVAGHFQLTEREVVADLERVAMCGLPPYGPGDLIDLFIDDGIIYIGQRQFLTKPLRLSAPEGFALLVAGRAALQVPGGELADSLRSALDKLAAKLGDGPIEMDIVAPPFT